MILKCLKSVKAGGTYYAPGSMIDLDDEAEVKRLVSLRVVEYLPSESPQEVSEEVDETSPEISVVEELTQVAGVNADLAERMVKAGVTGIAMLQEMSPDELDAMDIKGIGVKTAAAIIKDAVESFE